MISILAIDWTSLWNSITALFANADFLKAISTVFNYLVTLFTSLFGA